MESTSLHKLFEPITIHGMTLRNRIVMPPMLTSFGSEGHEVTDRLIAYHRRRARGGVGLSIVEYTPVDLGGMCNAQQLGVYSDAFIPGFRRLTEAVHEHGAKIGLQIHHGGAKARPEHTGGHIVAPSAIPIPSIGVVPRELTIPQIEQVVEAFGQGARRAKEAGFDMVEIHGAHGYLVNQFLSPWFNRRTDAYGGSLENRLRFALEVIRRVRQAVGPDFPVGIRINGEELGGGGITLQDTVLMAPRFVEAGVDLIHVSVNNIGASLPAVVAPMALEPGFIVYAAAAVKQVVAVPVIAVGRINDPKLADRILVDGKADLIAMGRALLADPDLPLKAAQGRFGAIRKCFACTECEEHQPVSCSTNPELGREATFDLTPVSAPRTVWVVGGGVAGLEAATIAARRGHRVTLFERDSHLGGEVLLAAVPPHKSEVANAITSRLPLLDEYGVHVKLSTEVTAKMVAQGKPDVVIVATGSLPSVPPIPGVRRPEVVQALDILAGRAVAGPRVAVIGGGLVGVETAEYLAERYREVTIIEMLDTIACDMLSMPRAYALHRMAQLGVRLITGAKVEAVTDNGILINRGGRSEMMESFQTIVLATGNKPECGLAAALKGVVAQIHVIGDAAKPGRILAATAQAADVALAI